MLEAALPWTSELHLKNTDALYNATFGFMPAEREKGIIDIAAIREFVRARAGKLPVKTLIGYLEIGGPKTGRDFTDGNLEQMLRESLRHLKETYCGASVPTGRSVAKPLPTTHSPPPAEVLLAPSLMCADLCHLEDDIRPAGSRGQRPAALRHHGCPLRAQHAAGSGDDRATSPEDRASL